MSTHIVIAHYNEDISYLDNIQYPFTLISTHSIPKETFPNKGNEAGTYLKYIIDNYNNLPDYIAFLHGHNTASHRNTPSAILLNSTKFDTDYKSFNPVFYELSDNTWLNYPYSKAINSFLHIIDADILSLKSIYISPNAEFYVSKKAIHNNSYIDYILLYYNLQILDRVCGHDFGIICEQLWGYIFTKDLYSNQCPMLIYNENENTYIVKYNNIKRIQKSQFLANHNIEHLIIENGIEYIESNAFNSCINLKSVKLPSTLLRIENGAFANCINLTSINIPKSLIYIDTKAFCGCNSLNDFNIEFPNIFEINNGFLINTSNKMAIFQIYNQCDYLYISDNIKYIDKHILYNIKYTEFSTGNTLESLDQLSLDLYALKKIYIGDNIKFIDPSVLGNAVNLESIEISPNNKYYIYENGVLYDIQKSIILKYISTNTNSHFTIPASVVKIGNNAFANNAYLKTIDFPDTLKCIENSAFENSNIEYIKLPPNIDIIKFRTFANCHNLKEVIFNDSLIRIGFEAFARCYNLTSICLPKKCVELELWTFGMNKNIKYFKLNKEILKNKSIDYIFNSNNIDLNIFNYY